MLTSAKEDLTTLTFTISLTSSSPPWSRLCNSSSFHFYTWVLPEAKKTFRNEIVDFYKKLCSQIHLTYLKNSKLRQAFGKKNLSSCLNQSLLIAVSCDGETIWLIKKYGHIRQKAQTTLQEQDRGNVEFHGLEAYSEGHQVGRCREKTADSSSREKSPFRSPLVRERGTQQRKRQTGEANTNYPILAFLNTGRQMQESLAGCGCQPPRQATATPA